MKEYLRDKKPELVGIYFDTSMYDEAINIARLSKETGAIVVAGGPHATIAPETIIEDVDIVGIGEGEEIMCDLITTLPSGELSGIQGLWYKDNHNTVYKNTAREVIASLVSLSFPALDLVDMNSYFKYWHYFDSLTSRSKGINVLASRGCPFNCTYCQPTLKKLFGNTIRRKSPEYLIEEISYYRERYKVNKFFFHDDTFITDKEWAYRFFDVLERECIDIFWGCNCRINNLDEPLMQRMFEVGLRIIHFGIESGSQRILDEIYRKGINLSKADSVIRKAKEIGIHTGGFFMLGAPTETKEELNKTLKYAVFSKLDEASFSIVTPFPGTHLYDTLRVDKRFTISSHYVDFNYYKNLSYKGGNFNSRQLTYYQMIGLFFFYLHPFRWKYVFKHFLSRRGILRFYNKMKRFF